MAAFSLQVQAPQDQEQVSLRVVSPHQETLEEGACDKMHRVFSDYVQLGVWLPEPAGLIQSGDHPVLLPAAGGEDLQDEEG